MRPQRGHSFAAPNSRGAARLSSAGRCATNARRSGASIELGGAPLTSSKLTPTKAHLARWPHIRASKSSARASQDAERLRSTNATAAGATGWTISRKHGRPSSSKRCCGATKIAPIVRLRWRGSLSLGLNPYTSISGVEATQFADCRIQDRPSKLFRRAQVRPRIPPAQATRRVQWRAKRQSAPIAGPCRWRNRQSPLCPCPQLRGCQPRRLGMNARRRPRRSSVRSPFEVETRNSNSVFAAAAARSLPFRRGETLRSGRRRMGQRLIDLNDALGSE